MSANTKIEWADHTFNPWEGCTKVSAGCAHCYAEARNARFGGGTAPNWGPGAPRRRTSAHNWNEPRRWNRVQGMKNKEAEGQPWVYVRPRVFCASLADWLDEEVPIEWLAELLKLIRETPNLDWLLLTKRPENWKARLDQVLDWEALPDAEDPKQYLSDWILDWYNGKPPANVWIGTTTENQARADERIPLLLSIPALVRFLSCEPLLGPVDLDIGHPKHRTAESYHATIDWVICGGESGRGARPMNPDWARSLRKQCAEAGVSFFFKQWGEWVRDSDILHQAIQAGATPESRIVDFGDTDPTSFRRVYRVGKQRAGRLIDGVEHNAFPISQLSTLSSQLPR